MNACTMPDSMHSQHDTVQDKLSFYICIKYIAIQVQYTEYILHVNLHETYILYISSCTTYYMYEKVSNRHIWFVCMHAAAQGLRNTVLAYYIWSGK